MDRREPRSDAYRILVRLVAAGVIVVPGLIAIGIILNGNYW